MKKIISITLAVLFAALLWYFFLKPQDYRVSFEAKAIPGTIFETVKAWNQSFDSILPIDFESQEHFTQIVVANDSVHTYEWSLSPLNDSVSKVVVNIKDADHSFHNKLQVPFSDTDFEKGSRKRLLDFNDMLLNHLESFRVKVQGQSELFSSYCACVTLKTTPEEKAKGMMAYYNFLNTILMENQVELNGPPFVEVLDWDLKNNSLSFNFCNPIIRSEKLPNHPDIIYKRIFPKKALKAIYNGNYITSDRAWYTLMDHATRQGIAVDPKPVEVFFNNPNMGGNELKWRTEVYLPLKDSDE